MDSISAVVTLAVRVGLSALLAALAIIDLRDRKVPNRLVQPLLIASLGANAVRLALGELRLTDVALLLVTWAACVALWALHTFGGGDMKVVMALVALFPDQRLIYWLLCIVLAGLLALLVVGDGRAGLRRLGALLFTVGQGALPSRAEISAAYQARGRPVNFAISLAGVLYLWLSWPGL